MNVYFFYNFVNQQLHLFLSIQMGEPPLVRAAANIFRNLIYENRHQLTAGVIVAGWDKKFGGQVIYIED